METTTDLPRLLTAREAATYLRRSIDTVYRMGAAGVLRPIRLRPNGDLLFRADELEALLEPCGCGTSSARPVEPAAEGAGPPPAGPAPAPTPDDLEAA